MAADEPDLDAWIARWRGALVGLVGAWGAEPGEAIEVAQDAFAEAWVGRERLRGSLDDPAAVGPWLRGIARNLWRARRRARTARPRVDVHALDPPADDPDPEADPRVAALRREVDRLPEAERTVVLLHHLEGTELRAVAALLGTTERAVEGRLHRARRRLRERLERAERAAAREEAR